jgi:predicted DNA-binding transcriptional regulator YafY
VARLYTRVHRLLRLIEAIQARKGYRACDLARLCEVAERTVYADIDTLNASGIPCAFDKESNGYQIRPGFFMPPIELTFEEAMALTAVFEQIAGEGQVPFFGGVERAATKIRSQLPASMLEAIEPLDDRVRIDLPATMADESCRDVYDQVRTAIANCRALRCKYESLHGGDAADAEEFDFKPYCLWYCQRAFYAVGHHSGRGEVRRLKLNRFTSVAATDRPYMIPDHFDPKQDLGHAWRMIRGEKRHRVVIRFEPEFSNNASETRWHASQEEVEWDEQRRVTLAFTVDGLEEVCWFILGYGPGATVLEPPELIEKVRDLAKATVRRYE